MANQFSFDVESNFDAHEMDNAIDQVRRDLQNRYDFKNTPASVDFTDGKNGLVITAGDSYQLDTIIDIVRKKLAGRGISQKVLDTSKPPQEANLRINQEVPFVKGLHQDKAKEVTKLIREHSPKTKAQIQGESVRVSSASKDELQKIIQLLKTHDFPFPVNVTNFR